MLFFPIKVKCLEWSVVFAILAFEKNWRCNLEVGVQNMPFMAHAWVNANGKVIADDIEIPERLSIILSEPF